MGSIFIDERESELARVNEHRKGRAIAEKFVFFLAIVQFFFFSTLHSSHSFHLNYSFLSLSSWNTMTLFHLLYFRRPFHFHSVQSSREKFPLFLAQFSSSLHKIKKNLFIFYEVFYTLFFRDFHGRWQKRREKVAERWKRLAGVAVSCLLALHEEKWMKFFPGSFVFLFRFLHISFSALNVKISEFLIAIWTG